MSEEKYIKKGDIVYTPKWCAEDMVRWFNPSGICLEPCRGKSVIYDLLPKDSRWCEIAEGIDFYKFTEKVDWIVTNPPYSHFSKFIKHGMKLSDNSVWLLPTWKIFCGAGIQMQIRDYGGIKHMRHYGTGTKLGWSPLANLISAIHISRDYSGDISESWYDGDYK